MEQIDNDEQRVKKFTTLLSASLKDALNILEEGIREKDITIITRSLRKATGIRKLVEANRAEGGELIVLQNQICRIVPVGDALSAILCPFNVSQEEIILLSPPAAASNNTDGGGGGEMGGPPPPPTPEKELYLHLLTHKIVMAQQHGKKKSEKMVASARLMVNRMKAHDRGTLDPLASQAWQAYSLACEANGVLDEDVRNEFLFAHRTACLRLNLITQATLINLILRDFVRKNRVAQAVKFASKTQFPDLVSNNQHVRYLYYMGRIEALELEYGRALSLLQTAIRKTPTTGIKNGFRMCLYQLTTVVQLLQGETPERIWFNQNPIRLQPYFELIKAVRMGSIKQYEQCVAAHEARFLKDGTLSLINRLHSSVIKTGLKAINSAYSRISFDMVAEKLSLETKNNEAEFVCMKAIRDGVLDAVIDADNKCLKSLQMVDVYSSTSDPSEAFNKRTNFLLELHNESVKALRFKVVKKKQVDKKVDDGEIDEDKLEALEEEMDED